MSCSLVSRCEVPRRSEMARPHPRPSRIAGIGTEEHWSRRTRRRDLEIINCRHSLFPRRQNFVEVVSLWGRGWGASSAGAVVVHIMVRWAEGGGSSSRQVPASLGAWRGNLPCSIPHRRRNSREFLRRWGILGMVLSRTTRHSRSQFPRFDAVCRRRRKIGFCSGVLSWHNRPRFPNSRFIHRMI